MTGFQLVALSQKGFRISILKDSLEETYVHQQPAITSVALSPNAQFICYSVKNSITVAKLPLQKQSAIHSRSIEFQAQISVITFGSRSSNLIFVATGNTVQVYDLTLSKITAMIPVIDC
jgi:WD40 repeat protein